MGDVQDKSSAYAALDEAEVDDYLESILNNPGASQLLIVIAANEPLSKTTTT
jgi:hypothetical protein